MPGPELLAPAGDWEALVAAVQNGADAVYLGATAFNARRSAANFEPRQLSRAVDYAHVRDVKVYVTVNVLVADGELEAAARLLGELYNIGADAVIVQDLGLMRLIRELLPDLAVHASTQATVHNLPALELLKGLGVRRVVLARELSLEEIAQLRRQSGLEVEVFVHGALCVSYSGQCLLSSLVGGRSGNRGRCAQPCSLPYTLYRDGTAVEAPGPYILRPRDLNLSAHLPELVRAGVDALKIEGRMRRPEYVATVVRIYRRLLDRVAAGRFAVTAEEERELAQVFNRCYSTGYLFGRPGRALMAYSRPNNRGLVLGRVRRFAPAAGTAEIELEAPLAVGDRIEVWVSVGGRIAATVREMRVSGRPVETAPAGAVVTLALTGRVRPGDRVFKTEDAALERRARETFASPREQKRIPLRFTATVREGAPLELEAQDPGGFAAKAVSELPAVRALRRPLTEETLREQLDRLGNTPFALGHLDCRIEGAVMLPWRELNAVRRRVLENLEVAKTIARRPPALDRPSFERRLETVLAPRPESRPRAAAGRRPLLAVAAGDPAAVKAAVESGADVIYFPGEGLGAAGAVGPGELTQAGALCRRAGVSLVLWLPRILHDRDLKHWWRLTAEADGAAAGVLVGNLGALLQARKRAAELIADFPLNTFNRLTASLLAELGADRVTLSPELTLDQVRELTAASPVPVEVLVHGALPVMVSEYCAVGGLLGAGDRGRCGVRCRTGRFVLRDRLGLEFPVGVDTACRMHIFNAKDLCAVELIPALAQCGVAVFRVEARLRDAAYVREVVGTYREVIDLTLSRGTEWRVPGHYKERLRALNPQGLTSGHYFRGVLE